MDNRSIGVFDSGLGGLTAVKELMRELPNENIIYFGDTGRVPYGTRSKETIIKYSKNDIGFLLSKNVKLIVVACGTVSSTALPVIRDDYDVPIIGVVEPASKAALAATKNGKIGIIGTNGTIKSGAYERCIKQSCENAVTYSAPCPLFVPLAENGHFDTEMTRLAAEEYLSEIKSHGVDTLILGCTHYPLLKNAVSRFMGDNVTLIDAGAAAANELKRFMKPEMMRTENSKPRRSYYVSDDTDGFAELGGIFLQQKIDGQVEKIDIEKYK